MIITKVDLCTYLDEELKFYCNGTIKNKFIDYLTRDNKIVLKEYIKLLRKTEYWYNCGTWYSKIMYLFYRRHKNILGRKLGIEIWENSFERGLRIYHPGAIVINGSARIGKNCRLHGDNCIGNNGKSDIAPTIGNNVTLGVGAKVIGDVKIADDIVIGAGAVVINSFTESGITIAGVPAKKVK